MVTASRRVVITTPQLFVETKKDEVKKELVAAYARVSTEKEEQEDSFEHQVEHYKKMIAARRDWQLVDIYADPGLSGTRVEKRPDFLRMIDDCRAGKIQRILVKSISRFARNTVDALNYIRELKDMGVSVVFESENIDTLTPGGEVLLTILAAMAEQESRTISSNVKWAFQRRFQAGHVLLNTKQMLGYLKVGKDPDGRPIFEINEEEAAIVRRIFREYVAGISACQICRRLEADGIPTKKGKEKWTSSVITNIISNEKYTGNAYLGKTYKPDVLTKKRYKNDGTKAPMYYVEHTHPAIVSEELFGLAQKERERRKAASENAVGGSRFSGKYPFSGLLICGKCGSKYRRHVRTFGTGEHVPAWGCVVRIKEGRGACPSKHISESVMNDTFIEAVNEAIGGPEEIVAAVKQGASFVFNTDGFEQQKRVKSQIKQIQEDTLQLHRMKVAQKLSTEEYQEQLSNNKSKMMDLEREEAGLESQRSSLAEAAAWLDTFAEKISSNDLSGLLDPVIVRTLVEKILVNDDTIVVFFKCGAIIEKEYVK